VTAQRRVADLTRGVAALALTAGLVLGVPAGLWTQVGWPLPSTLPTWSQLLAGLRTGQVSDQVLIDVLAVVCWIAWAQLVLALTAETLAALRGYRSVRPLPVARPLQAAAARLVAAIALLGALMGPRAAIATPAHDLGLVVPIAARLDAVAAPAEPSVPSVAPARYTVQARDDLWTLAERHLGDPYRWPEIHTLNQGRPQADGGALDDPDLLYPGWRLEFPIDAVGLPTAPPTSAAHTSRSSADGQPSEAAAPPAEEGLPAPEPTPADSPGRPPSPSGANTPGPAASDGMPDPAPSTPQSGPAPTAGHGPLRPSPAGPGDRYQAPSPPARPSTPRPSQSSDRYRVEPSGVPGARFSPAAESQTPRVVAPVELPSGSVVGATVAAGIAAALATARLHRRRRQQLAAPQPGLSHAEPLVTDTVRRLQRAATASSEADNMADAPHKRLPPGIVTAHDGDGHPVHLDLTAQGGMNLVGPGAEAAARGLLLDILASAEPGTAQVLLADPTGRLIPEAAPLPGLNLVSLPDAVQQLEIEVLARTRLLDTANQPDWRTLTDANPADPAPALLLLAADPDPALLRRLDTVAGLGRSLGLGALLLGRDPDGAPHVAVDASGTVTTTAPAGHLPDLTAARLPTLTPDEATELLAVLAAARDAAPAAEQPAEEATPFEADLFQETAPSDGRAISVTLFGPYEIEAGGTPIRTGLRNKARELLALLLLHPRGITLEQATAALWPDADPDRGTERFRTVLGNLRSRLRTAADLPTASIVDHLGSQRYQADAELFDCDLWRFQHTLTRAAAATDPDEQIPALQAAAAAYTGDLLDGALYEWVEPAREDLRRRAIDTLAHLATLEQQRGDPTAALAALDQAITHDPYAEALYQRIIRLQITLGQPDAARRTYRLLEARLAELDAEPDPATTALLTRQLTAAAGPEPRR